MLRPALFIGIGSTGLSILEKFEDLVFEHYGRPALPIFRYLALETREGAEVRRSEWGLSEIRLLKPVIRNTDAVRNALDAGQKAYLRSWLDPNLLRIPGSQFTDGAGNIRMAGRLLLWENWESTSQALNEAYQQISTTGNKEATMNFLQAHYARLGVAGEPTVEDLPLVYLVGTLCGGTCSGMFIDLAYYLKQITGLWARNLANPHLARVVGCFTVFDASTLNSAQQQGVVIHAANSWAAIVETNFFCHPQTRYQVTFPDATEVDTHEAPFDWLYLLSCTATDSANRSRSNFRLADGRPDTESLNHMVALNLFTETIGDLFQLKDAVRTDYRGRPRAVTQYGDFSPFVASQGVAAAWYPRFRIAFGAACLWGASLYRTCLNEVEPNTKTVIENTAQKDAARILEDAAGELTSTASGTLEGDVEQELEKQREDLLGCPTTEFENRLRNMLNMLTKGQKVDNHLADAGRKSNFKERLRSGILARLEELLNIQENLPYALYYLEKLDAAFAGIINKMPAEYPVPSASQVRGNGKQGSSVWARMVFKKAEVEREFKEEAVERLRGYLVSHTKRVRNYYLRLYLEEGREELGVGRQLPTEKEQAGELTLRQRLVQVQEGLETAIGALEKTYAGLKANLPQTQDIKIVCGDLEEEIGRLVAQLQLIPPPEKASILRTLRGGMTFSRFVGFMERAARGTWLKERAIEELLKITLARVEAFDVCGYLQGNYTPQGISDFALHALPHLEMTPGDTGLASVVISRPVSFLAGGEAGKVGEMLQRTLAGTKVDGLFEQAVATRELSHMLVFYREEPLMYANDNLATAQLFEDRYRQGEKASQYTLHTHRGGRVVFDPRIYVRRERTERELMPLALNLLSTRDADGNWVRSEIFSLERGQLVRRGTRQNGLNFALTADARGVELCAQEKEIYEQFSQAVEGKIVALGPEGLIGRLNRYLDMLEEWAAKQGKDPMQARHEEEKAIMGMSLVKEILAARDGEES